MLLWLLEKGEPIDAVIYMDTGWDFPEMADHLAQLEAYTGVKIEHVHYKWSFDYMLMDHVRTRGKLKGIKGYGFATPRNRWCTYRKKKAIETWVQTHYPFEPVCHYIGLAADEEYRAKPDQVANGLVWYPLIKWGKSEADCLALCREKGFTWGGLYDHFRRVSCWCCPLQPKTELKILWQHYPELWQKLKWMQSRSIRPFRADWTLEALERFFEMGLEDFGYEAEK